MLHLLTQQYDQRLSSPDCKSMVHLSLACKQLSSDVTTIADRILLNSEKWSSVRGITVFEENNHRTTCRIIANTARSLDRFVLKTYELFVNGTVGLAKLVHDKNDSSVQVVSGEILARILAICDQIGSIWIMGKMILGMGNY